MARGGGGASRKGTTGSSSKAPMPPATTTTTTDYEVPASQPSFAALEPIPEDTSVKRGENSRDDNNSNNRNIQNNFSTASAVASSDDDPEAGAARSVVSETPALLAGDETSPDRRRRHGRRGGATSSSSTKQVCTTRVKIYSAMVILLVVAVGIGIYFIVAQTSSSEDGDTNRSAPQVSISNNPPSAAPMMATTDDNIIGTFPPFDLGLLDDDLLSNAPSAAPTYNPADMAAMRAVLGQFSDPKALDREGTPQQRAFQWLTSGDRQELKAGVATDVEIRQRYALCVLFYSMAGEEWRDPQFLGPDSHECEWTGIACQRREVAYLDLHEMGLIGRLPSELTLLTGLNALRLYGNLISGELPSDIWDLPLIWADFSENFLTGDVPIPSGRSSVENLYLYDNDFTGTLPYFPNSMDVWASQNSFEDWDRRYATSNTLEHFAMYENQLFEKQLPSTWTAENLVYLDFGINQLTGTIPNSLWGLPKLESLVLHENQLSGTLPTAATKSIQHVWIQSNSLSGLIPASFGLQWSSLETLLLYDNSLSGQIGQDHCSAWAASMNQLEVDCTVECLCCTTECYPEDFDFGGGAVDEGATDDNTVTIFPVVRRYSNKGYFLRGADDSHS